MFALRSVSGDTEDVIRNFRAMPMPAPATAVPQSLTARRLQRPLHSRVGAIMLHIPWYTFRGQVRLARDVGVSRSTVCRLLSGKSAPSYPVMAGVVAALSHRLNRPLELGEVFSPDGIFPTASVCALCGCGGCLPAQAYDKENDTLRPEYQNVRSGAWELSTVAGTKPPSSTIRAAPLQEVA